MLKKSGKFLFSKKNESHHSTRHLPRSNPSFYCTLQHKNCGRYSHLTTGVFGVNICKKCGKSTVKFLSQTCLSLNGPPSIEGGAPIGCQFGVESIILTKFWEQYQNVNFSTKITKIQSKWYYSQKFDSILAPNFPPQLKQNRNRGMGCSATPPTPVTFEFIELVPSKKKLNSMSALLRLLCVIKF